MSDVEKKEEIIVPSKSQFRIIPKSFLEMTDCVDYVSFNICTNVLELHIRELKEFSILNWIVQMNSTNDEVLTLMASAPNKILCMLRFCDLTLLTHETMFTKYSTNNFGIENPDPVVHKINLKFATMERVNEPQI